MTSDSITEQAARALWEHDNAEGTTAEWHEMAWNDMGGSEPSWEREAYMLRADALRDQGLLTNEAPATDTPAPCVMTHTEPFDFAQCETHDTTFPLGSACKFHGRDSIAEVYADEADQQRGRAVMAEGRAEEAEAALAALRAEAPATEDARQAVHRALAAEWMTVANALSGNQKQYEAMLDGIVAAVRGAAPATEDEAAENYPCQHHSATGVDATPLDAPSKTWRCDVCGLQWEQDQSDWVRRDLVPAPADEDLPQGEESTLDLCLAQGGLFCTRGKGHRGKHVATGPGGKRLKTWGASR